MKIFYITGDKTSLISKCNGRRLCALGLFCLSALLVNAAIGSSFSPLRGNDQIVYRLAPFDLVQISVYGQEDLTTTQRISDEGKMFLPLLGGVSVGGKTVAQVSTLIEELYVSRGYLREPVASINIEEFSPKVVTVLGEVEKPGPVEIPPGRNSIPILVAVAGAGGFTGLAKLSDVQVKAGGLDTSQRHQRTVNVSDSLKSGDSDPNGHYLVEPDDIVFVPKRVF